ncbi:magnesium/cobalt transporter CorA [Synechococcales cyanobacterium C]|uniref:Magnesium transport protein CorA n=1 Tax=Petrachloros mirabilis ULC683 TaxID=2781853 RepID=A0A8K2A085_9CYAN|nr:magnesium/cobalt transporter CorA [Petrachloros mirabilis]NCJ07223.1 magnesium/cobalt transporter CorA [Petrachloros mirabilis ULC683]
MAKKNVVQSLSVDDRHYFYDAPGTIPGQLRIDAAAPPTEMIWIDYNPEGARRTVLKQPEDVLSDLSSAASVSWVDVRGLGDEKLLVRLGEVFQLHPLVLEDIVNVPQRPKVEVYDRHLVMITQMVIPKPDGQGFWREQVSLILGQSYLLTVQEEPEHDCFDPVRDRIRYAKGAIRNHGADYLAYALLDSVIDGFFPVLEEYGERIEALEDEVMGHPTASTLDQIHQVRRELLLLRRAIWPQREAINILIRDASPFMSDHVRIYLRDCYDHAIQVLDMVETYRELASSLMDVYLSAVSNRMNEIMKVLTVISTVFIPITFIVGVYGMNFKVMPELEWQWGYLGVWIVMLTIVVGLVVFFWKRGWFRALS